MPPDQPDRPVEYEIAGVVAMPGWHWMTKVGFRRGRAAGLMFADATRPSAATSTTGTPTARSGCDMDRTATEGRTEAEIRAIVARNSGPRPDRGSRRQAIRGAPAADCHADRSADGVRAEIREPGRRDHLGA